VQWYVVVALVVVAVLVGLGAYDLLQRRHAILRNFPVIGHLRFLLESVGPELRQYIVTDNDQERPFSRDQRRWIYTSAKGTNTYFGFGTDNNLDHPDNYVILKHVAFPAPPSPEELRRADPSVPLPAAKVLGAAHGRPRAFRPDSVVNVSAMSFGSLSARAIEALNRGAAQAGCLHNTGEGGISPHHLHGADLVWQIGTGYFGTRNSDGTFSLERFRDTVAQHPQVRAIEIKLSQGAKPGLGGVLPAAKVTPEIAAIRGVPVGVACLSPPNHSAFGDVDSLLEFVEVLAAASGLPVGIKSAVGEERFWLDLTQRMARTGTGVDFVTVDGGEGGTGAAPLAFSDHVALPFRWGFSRVYRAFAEQGLHQQVVFVGSGKLGLPDSAMLAMALGVDLLNVGREAMMAVGCIQAQRCHEGHCPTGVATQSAWLQRGLDPATKSERVAHYLAALRFELRRLARACGQPHPALVPIDAVEILRDEYHASSAREVFDYLPGWGLPSLEDRRAMLELLAAGWPPGAVALPVRRDAA
jgi:glutamate synthase domain-containing protein 2